MQASFIRRSVGAVFTVLVAMVLSFSLAVPVNAATASPSGPGIPPKPLPTDPRFKYGLDYYYKEIFDPNNPKGWSKLDVGSTVNPSNTGGTWTNNGVTNPRTLPSGTANKPLTGKIITPGKTVVKPPSVYKPTAPFAAGGALGLGRLLGASGFGIGGVTEAPSNWKEIAQTKVSAGCNVSTSTGCTSADWGQILSVSNCGHTATCKALGGKDASGNLISSDTDWFKDTAIPFLKDLWSMLTGQGQSADASKQVVGDNSYNISDPRGCWRKVVSFVPNAANNGGTITTGQSDLGGFTVTHPNPGGNTSASSYWNTDCGYPTDTSMLRGAYYPTCTDVYGNSVDGTGAGFGIPGTLGTGGRSWDSYGKSIVSFCKNGSTLKSVRFQNNMTQAYVDSTPSVYGVLSPSEWITPDTSYDSTDQTKITTTVDCRVPTGETYTYSKTVEKVAAFETPSCPEGSELIRHDVTAATAGGKTATIDSGGEVAGTATKYPTCAAGTGGCSLSVEVDGQKCTTSRQDCREWVATATQTPSRVSCKWGTNVMPVSDCYVIAEGYKTDIGVVLDPRSGSWTGIDSAGAPVPLSPAPWNPANPAPVVGQAPGTTPGGSTGTAPSSPAMPSEGVNPESVPGESGQNCLASGWSWNPVSWVMVPTQCALQWAFVPPQPRVDAALRVIEPKLQVRGIEPFVTPVLAGVSNLGGSGCAGPPIDLAAIHLPVMYPFSACDAPMSTIAAGTSAFFSLAIVIQGGMSCIRGVASAFGFNWGLGAKSETEA